MNASILGAGWVTPLGVDLEKVYLEAARGGAGKIAEITNPHSKRSHQAMQVPPAYYNAAGANARMRRSSPISLLTATAALAALADAGIEVSPQTADRIGVVFAVSSGSVVYTRRFYEQVALQGAKAASPALFPETVYNAPASHLAAILGVSGQTYTAVGDGAVGLTAIHFAAQLLATSDIDLCVVVGGEELDWVICEGYKEWELSAIYSDGAAAVVLGREIAGKPLVQTHPGEVFVAHTEAAQAFDAACASYTATKPDLIVTSANGTHYDSIGEKVLDRRFPAIPRQAPRIAFGEALGAGAVQQVVFGTVALRRGDAQDVLVTSLGFNEQAAAARIASLP